MRRVQLFAPEPSSLLDALRSVKKSGSFKGTIKMTVKSLFGGKAIKAGSYRLKVSSDKNSKLLFFRAT